jgi:hypothetical protein
VAVAVAPPAAAPDPEPTDKLLATTPTAMATAKPASTRPAASTQPTAATQPAAPVVTAAPPSGVDPFVQAVQQDIQQELDSRKKH